MINRKDTTKLLTDILLQDRLRDRKYYAKEVTLDYGTIHSKRVDVIQFIPKGVTYSSDMEKGIFICYEIKSCKDDVYSGNGLNFFGEKNYIVTTMETYKMLQEDLREGRLGNYIKNHYPDSSQYYGILVPVPSYIDMRDSNAVYKEYENPTKFEGLPHDWKLWSAVHCNEGPRKKPITELLFCMLRSKHNYTNQEKIQEDWNE